MVVFFIQMKVLLRNANRILDKEFHNFLNESNKNFLNKAKVIEFWERQRALVNIVTKVDDVNVKEPAEESVLQKFINIPG